MQDELLSFLLCKIWEESSCAETEKPGAYYCSLLIQSTVTILVKKFCKACKVHGTSDSYSYMCKVQPDGTHRLLLGL